MAWRSSSGSAKKSRAALKTSSTTCWGHAVADDVQEADVVRGVAQVARNASRPRRCRGSGRCPGRDGAGAHGDFHSGVGTARRPGLTGVSPVTQSAVRAHEVDVASTYRGRVHAAHHGAPSSVAVGRSRADHVRRQLVERGDAEQPHRLLDLGGEDLHGTAYADSLAISP